MSDIKLKATNGGGSISLKGPSTLGTDRDLVDTSGNINLLDSQKVKVGTDADLQLFHDGVSRIIHSGAGNLLVATEGDSAEDLYLRAKDKVVLQANNGNDSVICNAAGSTALYHNNALQCETSATGLAFPSGKGIDFSATANSSGTMTSELLDEYEEGTFTPTYVYHGGTGTIGYSTQSGTYTKIGNRVLFSIVIIASSHSGTSTGNLMVAGLPYAVPSTTPIPGSCFFIIGGNFTTDYGVALQTNSSERIEFYRQTQNTGANYSAVTISDVTAAALYIKIQGQYYV